MKTGKTPIKGYKVPKEYGYNYRATAIAYLHREGLKSIEHTNGLSYTLDELKRSTLGNKKELIK